MFFGLLDGGGGAIGGLSRILHGGKSDDGSVSEPSSEPAGDGAGTGKSGIPRWRVLGLFILPYRSSVLQSYIVDSGLRWGSIIWLVCGASQMLWVLG